MKYFLSKTEIELSKEFEKKGYIIRNIKNIKDLKLIKQTILNSIKKNIKINFKRKNCDSEILNFFHKYIKKNYINDFRLKIFNEINSKIEFKKSYYNISKEFLDLLVGNELAIQRRINLSIQMPKDNTSLLPLHSDVWSGDSPFEVVAWLPLVDCYKSKGMFILPPSKYDKLKKIFLDPKIKSSKKIYYKLKKDLEWIKIDYGQILIFNQCLPHGNIVNETKETRWSLNCRFKSIFTPYNEKKLGEFFEPITLKKISEIGMKYHLPKINEKS